MLGYARGLAELSQVSIRGGKRAVDAVAAGMSQETPGYRALAEAAGLGPDFAEGRAAFAAKRGAISVPRANRAAGAELWNHRASRLGRRWRSIRLRDQPPRRHDPSHAR